MLEARSFTGFDISSADPGILIITFNRPETLQSVDSLDTARRGH